jgi:hypothetical protein
LQFLFALVVLSQAIHTSGCRVRLELIDKLWLLCTFVQANCMIELQRQLLNVINVGGLDTMRSIVTDLLQGYLSETPTHLDTRTPLVRVRQDKEGSPPSPMEREATRVWDDSPTNALSGCRCAQIEAEKRSGKLFLIGVNISCAEYAHHHTWDQVMAAVKAAPHLLREKGHIAIEQYLRSRAFDGAPKREALCKRCHEVEMLRRRRAETGHLALLPHPATREITWIELAHHSTWREFAAITSPEELLEHAEAFRDAVAGTVSNVFRIDKTTRWCIEIE